MTFGCLYLYLPVPTLGPPVNVSAKSYLWFIKQQSERPEHSFQNLQRAMLAVGAARAIIYYVLCQEHCTFSAPSLSGICLSYFERVSTHLIFLISHVLDTLSIHTFVSCFTYSYIH